MVSPENIVSNSQQRKRGENYFVPCVSPISRERAPTTADIKDPATGRYYPIHIEWRDNSTNDIWKLIDIAANLATWIKFISGGSSGSDIEAIDVDFNTAPGTDPVVPDANGLVSIYGNVVANGTNANSPVATHSRAANQFHVDVQLGTAITTPADPYDVGLSSYNSTHFDIDANGWVSAKIATTSQVGYVELATTAESKFNTYGTTQVLQSGNITAMFASPSPIGTTLPSYAVFNLANAPSVIATQTTAATNSINTAIRSRHATTGTPVAGFGSSIELSCHDSTNAFATAARISGVWTDATNGSLDSYYKIEVVENNIQVQGCEVYPTRLELRTGSTLRLGTSSVDVTKYAGDPNTNVTAAKGSFCMNTSGAGTNDRAYINTDGATAWTPLLTGGTKISWTPALTFGGGSTGLTYSTQVGYYYRIGDMVYFTCAVTLTAKGSSTGNMSIGGLPASPLNNTPCTIRYTALTYTDELIGVVTSTPAIQFQQAVSGGALTTLTDAEFADTTAFQISGMYFV